MDRSKIAYTIWPWGTATREQIELAAKEIAAIGFTCFEGNRKDMYTYDLDLNAYQEMLKRNNLRPISFFFNMGKRGEEDLVFEKLEKELDFVARLDVKRICLQGTSSRPDLAHPDDMPQDALEYELDSIGIFAEKARSFGITPCLHPHHYSWIMYETEIDYLLQNLDEDLVMFAPDTAHLVAAYADPVEVIRKHAERVGFTHLKDFVYGAEGFSNNTADVYDRFCELGTGNIDFAAIMRILEEAGFDGYHCIEQDKAPVSKAQSARNNLKYLESIL